MEEESYVGIFNYTKKKEHPLAYDKSHKYVLHQSCKSFVVAGEELFYIDCRANGSTFNRLVLKAKGESE